MKPAIAIFLSIIIFIIVIISCEKHKDPFSSLNSKPEIQEFKFDSDSLKYKKDTPFKISLKYKDDENQKLTATFKFISGHGDIYHSSFIERSQAINSIVFDAPSEFDSSLYFIPDTTGKVEIELELSDRVKSSTQRTETFFFFNLKPVASFTYRLLSNVSPYEVQVDASASYDPDKGTIEWYYWQFDDGTPEITTKAKTWNHIYQQAGSYSVRLRVVDNDGGDSSTVNVIPTNNQPPLAILQVQPVSGEAPLTIRYTATNSIDPDGKIVVYRVDFDDGSSSLDSAGVHTYNTDENYRVRLQVTDNLGQTDSTGVTVKVATPPVAILKVTPSEGPFPLNCTINGTDSYDPQGGKIEHDIYINGELRYNNVDSVVHTFDAPEKYQVRLVVTNERNGLIDQKVQSINVFNLNPVADFSWVPQNPSDKAWLTYTSTSKDSNLTDKISYYKWTFLYDGKVKEGADSSIVHQFFTTAPDSYKVKLEVWDKYRGTKFEGYNSIIKVIPKK